MWEVWEKNADECGIGQRVVLLRRRGAMASATPEVGGKGHYTRTP